MSDEIMHCVHLSRQFPCSKTLFQHLQMTGGYLDASLVAQCNRDDASVLLDIVSIPSSSSPPPPVSGQISDI